LKTTSQIKHEVLIKVRTLVIKINLKFKQKHLYHSIVNKTYLNRGDYNSTR
jgi:hypothetical protein